jgi:radical SAM superfamily enzyme YgiQ (UPF0313 family)
MARGLLISYSGFPTGLSSLYPDNGLAILAADLLSQGHEVRILDYNNVSSLRALVSPEVSAALKVLLAEKDTATEADRIERVLALNERLERDMRQGLELIAEDIAHHVETQRSHFLGFKLWSGDGFHSSVLLAERLRQRFPAVRIFGGGPAVLYGNEEIFNLTKAFDALVAGEGDLAILELAEHSERGTPLHGVPNLIYPDGGRIRRTEVRFVRDVETLPRPVYDPEIYGNQSPQERVHFFMVDDSRGCPRNCGFCNHHIASGSKYRLKSAQTVQQEMAALHDQLGVHGFRLSGSFTPPRFLKELSDLLIEDPRPFRFCGFSHPDSLPDDVGRLYEAGCRALFFGVESFDPADAPMLGKRVKPEASVKGIQACLEAGITPVVSLIFPAPGQSEAGQQINRDLATELLRGGRGVLVTQIPVLLPGTPWWKARQEHGFELTVGEAEYQRLLATYKIRHLVPSQFWQPLPYTLDGRDFAGYTALNSRFQQLLIDDDVAVNIGDDIVLIAELLGRSVFETHARHRAMFFAQDVDAISQEVVEVNAALRLR